MAAPATSDSKGNSSARHGSRLRSLLPKVLLYDNVYLSQKLNREVTYISVEERKSAFTWAQMQRRFITDQAMKQEVHGMNLFPQINPTGGTNFQPPPALPERSHTMVEYSTIPPICSPTAQVARVNRICDQGSERDESKNSRPGTQKPRRRRTNNPLRDTRYIKLHRMLTDLPVNMESRLYIVN